MPKKAHESLKKQAAKKGLTGKRKQSYIYGTLSNVYKRNKNGS